MKFKNILGEILQPWKTVRRIKHIEERTERLETKLDWVLNHTSGLTEEIGASKRELLFLTGQIAAKNLPKDVRSIQDTEFHVFSQFGEDGIIQYLINNIRGIDPSFVEFGVQHYLESNTLFLLMNNRWRGLILDGERGYIDGICKRGLDWKYGLKAVCTFVTRENINDIFRAEGFADRLGLLSIDVDGMDWHLWDALTVVRPAIVICEYNRNLPADRAITVPYEPIFDRTQKHPSNWYFGASLLSLTVLAKEKGYQFVGIERHQRNAIFVRADLAGHLPIETVRPEMVDPEAESVMAALKGMPFFDANTRLVEVI